MWSGMPASKIDYVWRHRQCAVPTASAVIVARSTLEPLTPVQTTDIEPASDIVTTPCADEPYACPTAVPVAMVRMSASLATVAEAPVR